MAYSRAMAVLVSACIIARDEERVLGRCIASIREACQEICVVDTGSTDRTAELALDAGARVVRFTGCNDRRGRIIDFSAARNQSLALATGRWALWIDADEVLAPGSAARIAHHAASRGYAAVQVRMENGRSHWPVVRLFRRTPSTRFAGIVHEWPELRGGRRTDPAIVIRNHPDKRGKESAVDRDIRLCRRALAQDPGDARMLLYLARAHHRNGELGRAIAAYRRYAAAAPEFRAGCHHAWHSIASCELMAERWPRAIAAARRAIAIDPDRAESHCAAGDAWEASGNPGEAIAAYRRALACPLPADDYPLFTDLRWYRDYPEARLRRLAR